MAFEQPRALRNVRSPSSTRLVAQTAVGALVQAASVEIIEPILPRHTPGVPEVCMTRETPTRAECDLVHFGPSGITFSRKVKLQPEARDSHRVCAGAFVHSINAFGVGCVRLVVWGVQPSAIPTLWEPDLQARLGIGGFTLVRLHPRPCDLACHLILTVPMNDIGGLRVGSCGRVVTRDYH